MVEGGEERLGHTKPLGTYPVNGLVSPLKYPTEKDKG